MVKFRRVLCPIDLSESSAGPLACAVALTRWYKARLTLLTVVPTFDAVQVQSGELGGPVEWLTEEELRPNPQFSVVEYRQQLVESAQARLRTLIADAKPGCATEDVAVVGRAHREIVQAAATNQTDLIVMGAQGRGGIGLALFGSTTQQVVRAAECPVLTVRAGLPG